MRLRPFLVYFPKYQLILIVGFSERIGIHVSNVLLCPFPELFWPIYSLIIRNRWTLQNRNGWEFQLYWGAGVLLLCLSLKILFLLHVDKLYSSQALLNCHIVTGGKSYRHSQADDLWKISVHSTGFLVESQHAHLLSLWPKALRKFHHTRYAVCSTKGRVWVCCWDLSV